MNAGEYLRWTDNDSIRSVGGVFRFNASGTNVLNMTPSMLDMKTNMNVEGLAHFEAGISSDGGITAGGEVRSSYFYGIGHETGLDVDTNNTLVLRAGDQQVVSAGTTKVQVKKLLQANELIHAKAGISADGGITVGGEIRAVSDIVFNGGSAIQNDSGSRNSYIYFEDGNNGQIRFRPDNMPGFSITRSEGVIVDSAVRFRSNPIAEFMAGISADRGINLGTGITFPDGTFQSTAASGSGGSSTQKYSMGFFYDGRGSNLSTGYISDIVRNVEQGATATKVTVYYPTAVTATAGVELYKVGTSYFNSPGASFEANGTLIAGVSVDSGDYGASAGIAVALSEDDMVFGRLTNSGHTDKLQIFLKYESSS